ncbi:hypothetical protein PAQ31011_01927 [Pandoraea aquatica]|uniref:Uncharacterized protein n=1 Tax=Pandoraea aquatica TaxID=2508290 RepID=A0A5E4UET4_9BURK|nr:hypothetical protein [Pandoraea aquatica]VVD96739.1 hypothetical protein PAQ31011_01927 [Pandoraea aquatica]
MLNRIVVGDLASAASELRNVLSDLRLRLLRMEVASRALQDGPKNAHNAPMYGPYLGRAYLETACTALLARMDPFRVLAAKRHQEASYYAFESRSKSGIQWSGDIVSPDKPTSQMWAINTRENGCRSLFGPWTNEVIWIPAFERLGDAVANSTVVHAWVSDLSNKQPEGFCAELRSSLEGLFSKFSKGVHSELLANQHAVFDSVSIESDFHSVAQRLTCFALLSHFSDHFLYRLSADKALDIANRIGSFWK